MSIAVIAKSQFIQGIGITGGISYGNQKFTFLDPFAVAKKKYVLGFNGSLFLENFDNEYVRWVTELQYNEKGSRDKNSSGDYLNKLQYGCWNNYLKFRYEMYRIIPYIMPGVRIEYKASQSIGSPSITKTFFPLHLSVALGGGVEFVSFGNVKFFVEAFYNPDIGPAYEDNTLSVRNKNFELRVGLKYQRSRGRGCVMPRT